MIENKEKNFISAVVYIHNCEKVIEDFLNKINNKLNEKFEKYEIICVNDNSTDNSLDKIKLFSKNADDKVITIINMSYYQGLEKSMNAGVDLAIGDFVYEFDSVQIDYDLDVIIDVYYESLKGYDIVSASSDRKEHFTSKVFYDVFNKNSNTIYPIYTERFRILSRRAINRVNSLNITIPYRKAIYANCGLKLKRYYIQVNKKY